MTFDNRAGWDGSVYGIASENSTELVIQPYGSRHQVMKTAWVGMLAFVVLMLPSIVLLAFIVTVFCSILASNIAPGLQNAPFMRGAISFLWGTALLAFIFLIWKATEESGYKTFIFDRTQQKLIINTATIVGRKSVKIIPFSQIYDARWDESQYEGISMNVFLVLNDRSFLGLTLPNKIILSGFSKDSSKITVETLTARKHHQELLLSVRNILGLSTYEISAQLQRLPAIPTAAELERQQAQAITDAKESLGRVAKMVFASPDSKSMEIESLRSQTQAHPTDPEIWEQLALTLALQKKSSTDEIISAYRQAEILYLDRGNLEKADEIGRTLKRFNC